MPLYEYQCEACRQRFEVIQKFSDPAPDTCRACGKGPVQRLPSSPAIQFKGSGFYITDYAQKGKPSESDGGSSGEGKDAPKDTKETKETKETKKDTKSAGESSGDSSKPASPAPTSGKTDASS